MRTETYFRGFMLSLLLISYFLFPASVVAQGEGDGWKQCETNEPGRATIRGRLLPFSTGRLDPVGRAWLRGDALTETRISCGVQADSTGQFEYRGLPPGDYELRYSDSGLNRTVWIPVRVDADTLIVLDLPRIGDNPVLFCLQTEECAKVLTHRSSVELKVGEDLELNLLGHRLALAFGGEGWTQEEEWVACLPEEAPDEALPALSEVYQHVVPMSECEYRAPSPPRRGWPDERFFHKSTSRPARAIGVDRITRNSDDLVQIFFSFWVGDLWGEGWLCEVRKANGVWFPETCSMQWIS